MPIRIEELTTKSLLVSARFQKTLLGSATAFLIAKDQKVFLVSNKHVFSGRHPLTGKCNDPHGGIPDNLLVHHHQAGSMGSFVEAEYPLRDGDGKPLYVEHPSGGVDVALLPIKPTPEIDLTLADHHHNTALDAHLSVASSVSVIGFPFGLSSHAAFPIWKTGNIASEIDLPFQGQPCFLIDAATRGGMSGSPVYAILRGPYQAEGGGTVLSGSDRSRFMGIYSGRLLIPTSALTNLTDGERDLVSTLGSDIGMVWRPQVIDEILTVAARANAYAA